ncbi:MAG: hypothetical protein FJ098_03250 [Deltaproteobacteria bacterium]|nr:hypothetical protein [Deltaproteobacteria bacterium]
MRQASSILLALVLAGSSLPVLGQPAPRDRVEPVEVDVEPEEPLAEEPAEPEPPDGDDGESLEDLGRIENPFATPAAGLPAAPPLQGLGAPETGGEETGDREGAEADSLLDQLMERVEREAVEGWAEPLHPRWPWVEWHGYFRVRGDLLGRADLGTFSPVVGAGTSRVPPPLWKNRTNASGGAIFDGKLGRAKEKALGSTNMRFRLQPTIHVWDRIRIHTTVDFLDNVVLGSTPDVGGAAVRPLLPLDLLTRTQVPPTSGVNSWRDSVVIKEAWAEWLLVFDDRVRPESFNLGVIQVGRFAWPWGLGIVSSRGDFDRADPTLDVRDRLRAMDQDGGSYVDRILWTGRFGGINVSAGYGWLGTGPTSQSRVEWQDQAWDLEQSDDIHQVEIAIHRRPVGARELAARERALFAGRPQVDWGLYTTVRWQANAVYGAVCCEEGVSGVDSCLDCYGDMLLMDRSAWLVTPDLWFRLDWRPTAVTRLRAQLEVAMNIGAVEHAGDGAVPDFAIDVLSWGGALESIFWWKMLGFGLDAGVASGDNAVLEDPSLSGEELFGSDGRSTLFSFHQDYIVDMLLYREVLGTVRNSAYVRPHFIFDLLDAAPRASVGGTLAMLYAMSMEPAGTPGRSRHLGLELDAGVFYEEEGRFLADVNFGVLFPFDGLDRPQGFGDPTVAAKAALWAWTLQARLGFTF